ncbi:MAG: ABC transporter transmembrane domain-containing protein [Candidatus Borkfalkia sp.]
MSQITNENLEGARVVRAFSKRDKERARFDGAAEAMLQNSMRIGRISAYLNPLTFALVNLGIAAILFVSGVKVNIGRLTGGEIIAVISYMAQILNAMIVISNMVSLFTKAHASMNRVSEVFDLQSCIRDGGNAQPDFTAPAIQFENVSFSYAGTDKYALTDVSFSLEKGKTLGIIGGTGSGKTTLVNLFPRLYDCSLGSVKVFGHDVKDYSQESLRFWRGAAKRQSVFGHRALQPVLGQRQGERRGFCGSLEDRLRL